MQTYVLQRGSLHGGLIPLQRPYQSPGGWSSLKKEFATAALNKDDETFIVHIAAFMGFMTIQHSREAQIASLDVEEVTIPTQYSDYTDVFSKDSAKELPKHTGINDHAIRPGRR